MSREILRPPLIERAKNLWKITVKGEENLETAQQLLQGGPLVIIFNHTFSGDAFCGALTCWDSLLQGAKELVVADSKKHLDWQRAFKNFRSPTENMNRKEALEIMRNVVAIRVISKLIGVTLIPIVQSYDIDAYPEEALRSWRNLLKGLKERAQKANIVFLFAPEGHRTEAEGELQKAKGGIAFVLEKLGDKCSCLPLGIFLKNPEPGRGLNLKEEVFVNIGEPFKLSDLPAVGQELSSREKRQIKADWIMEQLAPLLPENQRGYYR